MSCELLASEPDGHPLSTKLESFAIGTESLPARSNQVAFDKSATKKLIRKLDWALIPLIALLYLLSFLDRANIGNARLAGLEKNLNMKGLDYNVSLPPAIS